LEVILDTNAVSAILAADPRIEAVLGPSIPQHLPVVVIAEYQFGILGSSRPTKLQAGLKRLESQSVVLTCDRATADYYASIRFELKRKGRPIPENDIWIAAIARQHSLDIASQDPHFDWVDGVRRIGW
jgi:predicted nucleic acid-binding protein